MSAETHGEDVRFFTLANANPAPWRAEVIKNRTPPSEDAATYSKL